MNYDIVLSSDEEDQMTLTMKPRFLVFSFTGASSDVLRVSATEITNVSLRLAQFSKLTRSRTVALGNTLLNIYAFCILTLIGVCCCVIAGKKRIEASTARSKELEV